MNNDIVQQLFEEAMSKDEKLNSINSRIASITEIKKDSLESYNTYIRNNNNYWLSVRSYASQLSDTLLREELKVLIDGIEKKYQQKLTPLNTTITQIEDRQRTLRDQEILMKILVTEPMMNNYQRNEYPNIKKLEAVKKSYDTLIKDVKTYTKINK
jgi:hypothetical protein